jgi:diguanylate cyclase (GGDEF)-like protein
MQSSISPSDRKRPSRTLPVLVTCLIGMLLWNASPVSRLDNVWSDLLLTCQNKPASDRVIIVGITADDVITHGQERLSRKFLAETLHLLADAEVDRVLMDFNLGAGVTAEEEQLLLGAFKRFGPNRLALAYEPDESIRTKPSLLVHATQVNLSLVPDSDGRVRALAQNQAVLLPNPCNWLSTGSWISSITPIDRRISPNSFVRTSMSGLHSGKVPLASLKGKKIIISHDRQLSKTRAALPIHGPIDRGTIFALGTESQLNNFQAAVSYADLVSLLTNIVLLLTGYLIGAQAPNVSRALRGIAIVGCLAIVISWNMSFIFGAPSIPNTIIVSSLMALYVAIFYRLRVIELIAGLLSGVLSPEEVWLWRMASDRASPVVLFDAMGRIKKANPCAIREFQLASKTYHTELSSLAKQCMPAIGERCTRLTTDYSVKKFWDLEWPATNLPLIIFTDATSRHEEFTRLQTQLYTDPMTNEANRAGFEKSLKELGAESIAHYLIIFMDMNGFKQVNDTYGHEAGDILLKVAAQRFRSVISPKDVLARLGGDEFAVILRGNFTDSQALKIRDRLESTLIEEIDIGQRTVKVGVAAGYAMPENNTETTAAVLRRADLAMYERKAIVKGRKILCSGSR